MSPARVDGAQPPARRNARYTALAVDGPVPGQMLAAIPSIRRDPLAYLAGTVARYGDLVAFPLPRTPVLLVNTPTGARRVLVTHHRSYSKRTVQYGALSAVTGAGLLTSDGETWRRSRRVTQPAFHHGSLDVVGREAVAAAGRLRQGWLAAGGVVDADSACLDATLTVVGRALFGADLADDGRALVRAVLAALEVVVGKARMPLPVPTWLPTPGNRALAAANTALDNACAHVVAARRSRSQARPEPDDLLDLLLRAVDAGELSAGQVRDELVTMVVAGHETVASTLAWTLHLLSCHPAAQQRLHDELDAVLGARTPQWEDLARLCWTRAVVDESLRLFPPAWVLSRRALVDDLVDGVPVPAGALVILSPWLLHRRHSEFPSPERFEPQRFLEPGGDATSRTQRGAYLPFGAGPRLCIGREFALVESVLVLATLLGAHGVVPVAGRRVAVEALVTLRPRHGLPLRLVPRDRQ